MNPKAGEEGSGALPRGEPPPTAGVDKMGSEVPEGLEPCCPRQMARAALVLCGRPQTPYLCVHGRRSPEWRRGSSDGRRVLESVVRREGGRSRRVRRESSAALAGEAAEPRAFKAALTFLGIPLANGRRPGRKREGGQSGFLSPPPAARRTTFQRESEGGGGGRVRKALELLRKRGDRPRGLGARGLSTSALEARRHDVLSVSISTSDGDPPKTIRGLSDKSASLNGWPLIHPCRSGVGPLARVREATTLLSPALRLPPLEEVSAVSRRQAGRCRGLAFSLPVGGALSAVPAVRVLPQVASPPFHSLPLGGGMRILIKGP